MAPFLSFPRFFSFVLLSPPAASFLTAVLPLSAATPTEEQAGKKEARKEATR
jgi:hypothetical protein